MEIYSLSSLFDFIKANDKNIANNPKIVPDSIKNSAAPLHIALDWVQIAPEIREQEAKIVRFDWAFMVV